MASEQAKKITAKDVTTPELYAYLEKNDLCEKYMNNLINENTYTIEYVASNISARFPDIMSSFTWRATKEGLDFWAAHSSAFFNDCQPTNLDEEPANVEEQPANIEEQTAKKQYRITYRSEIYVDATDEQEAESVFEMLDKEQMAAASFVEVVSIEEQE